MLALFEDGEPIGIAPLIRTGTTVSFMGDIDTTDYQDFVTYTGREKEFSSALIRELKKIGINQRSKRFGRI